MTGMVRSGCWKQRRWWFKRNISLFLCLSDALFLTNIAYRNTVLWNKTMSRFWHAYLHVWMSSPRNDADILWLYEWIGCAGGTQTWWFHPSEVLVSCKSSVGSHAANHQEAHAALCQCQSVRWFDFTTRWQRCAQSSCSPFIGLSRDASAWATEMCTFLFYVSCTSSVDIYPLWSCM